MIMGNGAAPAASGSSDAPVVRPERGTGPLRNGNFRGDPNAAPRCGARARTTGCACRAPAMPNGRCRLHGGKRAGPRRAGGGGRIVGPHAARVLFSAGGAAKRLERRHVWTVVARGQLL